MRKYIASTAAIIMLSTPLSSFAGETPSVVEPLVTTKSTQFASNFAFAGLTGGAAVAAAAVAAIVVVAAVAEVTDDDDDT